jgi:hypothetical protein
LASLVTNTVVEIIGGIDGRFALVFILLSFVLAVSRKCRENHSTQ